MPHIYTSFQPKEITKLVRAVDFAGILFDAIAAGTIGRSVATKAIIEVLIAEDVPQAAHLWSAVIDSHESIDLETFSFLEIEPESEVTRRNPALATQSGTRRASARRRVRRTSKGRP